MRNVKKCITLWYAAAEVNLLVLDTPWLDTSTPNGKFFFYSMALLDEVRRDIIVQNTKDGLAAARARGRKGGRPRVDQNKLKIALAMYESKQHSINEIVSTTGISQGTLYNEIKKAANNAAYNKMIDDSIDELESGGFEME